MKLIGYVLLIIILIIGVSFAALNSEIVSVHYYIGVCRMPLSLLMVITFAFGCFIGLLMGFIMVLRLKSQNYRLKNRIKLVEKEVSNLRTMPVQDNR